MGLLSELDLTKKFKSKREYRKKLDQYQLELLSFQRQLLDSKRSVILVFEGPDASGKGGVIKRITEKLDPRATRVYSISKPTPEELSRHYMWRFWTRIPPQGEMAIFDRSWYGRVLVERVEKFANPSEWKRAYMEINDFEKQLTDGGSIIIKFYLHISKAEQLRRFKDRELNPYKHWKINGEDWRNRKRWSSYIQAAEEMFELTSPKRAPWHVLSGEFKWYARVAALKTIVKRLEEDFGKPEKK